MLEHTLKDLATRFTLTFEPSGDGWYMCLPMRGSHICELVIGLGVLDWYVSVRLHTDGRLVWSDWMDYLGYNEKREMALLEDKCRDILWFTEAWFSATAVRVTQTRRLFGLFRSTLAEWEHGGRWEPIEIYDPNR